MTLNVSYLLPWVMKFVWAALKTILFKSTKWSNRYNDNILLLLLPMIDMQSLAFYYLIVSMRLSELLMNMALCRCRGRAPSASARSCILAAISASPSSMMAFITMPAPFTIAMDGCWIINTHVDMSVHDAEWSTALRCMGLKMYICMYVYI